MPLNWFIVKSDREWGPYTSAQLKQLAATGQLKSGHLVRRSDRATPVLAGKVQGLFPDAQTPAHPRTTHQPSPSVAAPSPTPHLHSETPKTTPPPLPSEMPLSSWKNNAAKCSCHNGSYMERSGLRRWQ